MCYCLGHLLMHSTHCRHQRTLTGSCRATSLAASATVIIDDFCLSSDVAVFADTFIDFCLSTGLPPLNDTFMDGCLASDLLTSSSLTVSSPESTLACAAAAYREHRHSLPACTVAGQDPG